jgi:hypothetical protein
MSFVAPGKIAPLRLPATCEENLMCMTALTATDLSDSTSPERIQIS